MSLRLVSAAILCIWATLVAPLAAQQGRSNVRRDAPADLLQGFNVVLLVGESESSGASIEEVPAAARRALNDMRDFLPFKHYRVLDSQWTSCCSVEMVRQSSPISGRLQGVIGMPGPRGGLNLVSRPYAFSLSVSQDAARLPVRFTLRSDDEPAGKRKADPRDATRARQLADLQAELASVRSRLQDLQARIEIGNASPRELPPLKDREGQVERHIAELTGTLSTHVVPGERPIIDSSFTMDAGETIVVGTSRLGGDKALIAIVTAVRKGGTR